MRMPRVLLRVLKFWSKPPKSSLLGGKKDFVAEGVRYSKTLKKIPYVLGPQNAEGAQGRMFDFIIYKGRHRTQLVFKKYHDGNQTDHALNDFERLMRLKKKGYAVPPTVRLVERKGEKYVALTDLTRYGNVFGKLRYVPSIHQWSLFNGQNFVAIESVIGSKKASRLLMQLDAETTRAKLEEKINLQDSWELVINTKTGSVRPFIIDMGISHL